MTDYVNPRNQDNLGKKDSVLLVKTQELICIKWNVFNLKALRLCHCCLPSCRMESRFPILHMPAASERYLGNLASARYNLLTVLQAGAGATEVTNYQVTPHS